MSFHSFRCHSIHSDVILLIPMSLHSFQSHIIHTNLITSFWRHSIHSDVIPFILSCLRWPRNDFISEWREWPWNANFSHSRLILVILCYPRWSRKDGIFPFSSLSFRCHSVIRTSFWDQESIETRSEWRIIWGRSRQSSLTISHFQQSFNHCSLVPVAGMVESCPPILALNWDIQLVYIYISSYVAVSASVIIWVPKSGESKSGQMVSEKVIWS